MKLFNIKKHVGLPIIYYVIKDVQISTKDEQLEKIINSWNNNSINELININTNYTSNLFNHFINAPDKS